MATTTRPAGDEATDGHAVPRRVVTRGPGMPGSRAVVGGLLVALAGVGTFVSWQQASGAPGHTYAVAARPLAPGAPVTADDIRFEPIDLPAGVARSAFSRPADLEGRVLVAPVGEGELLQDGALSDQGRAEPAAEVSLALTRDLAVDGRLAAGDVVDVYATHADGTSVVAEHVTVVAVTEAGGSFSDGRELTVTLALTDSGQRVPVIHAAREGQVTLVRTTHVARGAPADASPPISAPSGDAPAAPATPDTSGAPGASGTSGGSDTEASG